MSSFEKRDLEPFKKSLNVSKMLWHRIVHIPRCLSWTSLQDHQIDTDDADTDSVLQSIDTESPKSYHRWNLANDTPLIAYQHRDNEPS